MILTVDQVGDLLDEIAESFPSALFQGLNGGVCLQEEALPDPEFREVYILGEMCIRDRCRRDKVRNIVLPSLGSPDKPQPQ